MKKIFLTVAFTAVMVSAAVAQKSAKETIKEAKEILKKAGVSTITAPLEEPLEKCSYLLVSGGGIVHGIDDTLSAGRFLKDKRMRDILSDIRAIPAGNHVLHVSHARATDKTPMRYSGIQSVAFNFEEGKYYLLDSEITAKGKGLKLVGEGSLVHFFIKDLTDPKSIKKVQAFETKYKAGIPAEKNWYHENLKNENENLKRFQEDEGVKACLAYMEANPDRLDGIWSTDRKMLNLKSHIQFTIKEGKIRYQLSDNYDGEFFAEGRLLYNENTIVMTGLKSISYGHKDKVLVDNKYFKFIHVWYYTIQNDILHLEGGYFGDGDLNRTEKKQ